MQTSNNRKTYYQTALYTFSSQVIIKGFHNYLCKRTAQQVQLNIEKYEKRIHYWVDFFITDSKKYSRSSSELI